MKIVYNVLVGVLHFIGCVLFAAVCMSRWIFWLTWDSSHEVDFILCGVFVFGVHYFLVYIGCNRRWIKPLTVSILQIIEFITFLPQMVYLIVMLLWANVHRTPFGVPAVAQVIPILLVGSAIFVVRGFVKRILRRDKDT